ncbi:ATP-binding protein [Spirosoma sp.]|uniref:sensor histidine kinase n=1 Tax=Spirosoma sp. TaxID=1899569 RepID=UPI00260FA69F|nr:ATP-binding protein [Spirosoma sp.]MCX6216334.1 ATP-binding protein [Spirosoma sp.]
MTGHQQPSNNPTKLTLRLDLDFALQAAGLGVWEYNPQTGLVDWDERCRALYGISAANDIAYQQAVRHIHPDDADRVDAAVQRAIDPQSNGMYDETYRTIGLDDGRLRWVRFQGRAYFTPTGEFYRFAGIAQEVNQQVLAQQVLERLQEQQRFILQLSDTLRSLNDPLDVYYYTACLLGRYLGANRVGYAEDQGNGNTIVVLRNYINGVPDLQGTYQYADYGPLLAEFLAGRTVVRSDIAQDPALSTAEKEAHRVLQLGATLNKPLMKGGKLVAVLFIHYKQAHAWSDDELGLLEMVAERLVVAVDRTRTEAEVRRSEQQYRQLSAELESLVNQRTQELAEANNELIATNEELSANNEEYAAINEELEEANVLLNRSNDNLEQFAYVASHDLQEPLRKIRQFGDLLKARYNESEKEELAYVDRMQSAASRMSILIKDLLNFSRIATQREANDSVSLQTVVESVLSTLELRMEELGAQIQVGLLPTVTGDASQLSQLFQNLLSNALKFHRTNQAGALVTPLIEIRAQLVSADQLPAGVKPGYVSGAYHKLEVADNGIGFDEQYLDRIFQVFQRLHGKNQYAGTGVGLAICEKVVANHGGAITATSQPGQGATFTIYLPA